MKRDLAFATPTRRARSERPCIHSRTPDIAIKTWSERLIVQRPGAALEFINYVR